MSNDYHILPVDYHIFKSALNGYLARHCGGDRRPAFHDVAAASIISPISASWWRIVSRSTSASVASMCGMARMAITGFHCFGV